ncbi:glycosyltransferase family 1 protein [Zobellia galactanivorans]|uniref:glycosyltransferase family 4 protein n=1 Tax=Zobellia galactanivorans (strain DSM 12802 / CCUG 47099 / CIP 106680 / NCIMB 13871 / Dsij) TaxID=63186 RepID=UPI0026E3FA3A|nr:glycosyltransferase family 1 protein [Zobellia galactanivorans]MDO6810408.1 glycosyltransferase family 1 protein [Zobellia galactanivorans]
MKIHYFFRHPTVGFSIQRVFQTINKGVCPTYDIAEFFLPSPKSNFASILKNGFFAKKRQGKINHITGDAHYLLYFLSSKKTIVTVHDIMYFSYLSGIKKKLWKVLYINSLKRAKKVVFISEFAKNQVLKVVDLPESRYCVIPNPVSPDFSFEYKEFNKEKPVILHINGSLERKNLARTIEALHEISCHLRIVGRLSSRNIELLDEYDIDYSNVRDLSNEEIVNEYKNCDIVNFPSLFEGFGMPVIEGQAVGRPVVTSNISPMKYVAGEGAVLVDPKNVQSIKKAYLRVINDADFRNGLIEKGKKNVMQFQLKSVSEMYVNLYHEIQL